VSPRDTLPRVLVGPETPAEDIRNALSVIMNAGVPHEDTAGRQFQTFDAGDIVAVIARLQLAVRKLEASR
jgi:hypothetical protein